MSRASFHGTKILEDMDNPFLPDFYKKKKGAAFQTQLFFLLSRYQQQQEIAQIDLFSTLVVADYTFPKDKIFACLNLDDSELLIYDKLYTLLSESGAEARPRDLPAGVHRDLPEADQEEDAQRSRRPISPDTSRQLIEAYNYYFYHYEETPLLVVDTNEIDFVNRPADFEDLVAQIQKVKKGVQYYVPVGSALKGETPYNFPLALCGGDPDLRDVDRKERSERCRNFCRIRIPSPSPDRRGKGAGAHRDDDGLRRADGRAARRRRRGRPARRRLGRDGGLRRAEHPDRRRWTR